MVRNAPLRLLLSCLFLLAIAGPLFAENEGQAELDKATQLKVTAETLKDLNEVVDQADAAIDKGLDAENRKFADQLLVSSLVQRGQLFAGGLSNLSGDDPQRGVKTMQLRQFALSDLQRAVGIDDKQVDAHLLIAKLQSLPLGDPSAARRSLNKVVKSEDATPDQKAEAYALRSAMQKDPKDKLADLSEAVKAQPDRADYYRLRSEYYFQEDKFDDALADIDRAIKMEPDHAPSSELRGMILLGLNRYDEALKSFNRSSELSPKDSTPFLHMGELYRQKGELETAVEKLGKALEISPNNVEALLTRARVYFELKDTDKALADVETAIAAEPTMAMPHFMKVEILVASDRVPDAIAYLEKLLKAAPKNEEILQRLGSLYLLEKKPRKAIGFATEAIALDADSFDAIRLRADANLNIGEHAAAIADFEKALVLKEEDEGVLNNFAWVLATSPDDKLRDGARALKLAAKAAEVTKYETPHVLSTLAAAYAETGDFENAAKWSEKSIELSQKELDEMKPGKEKDELQEVHVQLKKELESYHDHKPTRERQSEGDDDKPANSPAEDHAAANEPAKPNN